MKTIRGLIKLQKQLLAESKKNEFQMQLYEIEKNVFKIDYALNKIKTTIAELKNTLHSNE